MKTLRNLILAIMVLALGAGCTKDNNKVNANGNPLLGVWQKKVTANSGDIFVEEYLFKSDGTFETRGSVANANSQILGYTSRSVGSYIISHDQMTLNFAATYAKTDNSQNYVPLDKLAEIKTAFNSLDYTVGYNTKLDSLSLAIHCPANASCVGIQWYQKQ